MCDEIESCRTILAAFSQGRQRGKGATAGAVARGGAHPRQGRRGSARLRLAHKEWRLPAARPQEQRPRLARNVGTAATVGAVAYTATATMATKGKGQQWLGFLFSSKGLFYPFEFEKF
ncbi:hypothetical protein BHE74_00040247 [Ensete ventricosum]|nr:hypothetical protein GW17_00041840 [Ensete ventricosum]RWW53274.1 hypothetical protein BHE74_00040247 [Ensete ventricosum]RZS09070.1 hypothetical protein BHM03_00040116 [Ensete ventricosum]